MKKHMLLVLAAGMLFLPLAACAGEEQEPIASSQAALQESSQDASSALKKTESVSQTESGVSFSAGSSGAVPDASAAQEDTLLEIVVNGQTFLADYQNSDEGGSYTPLAVVREPEGLSQAMAGETAAISFQMVTG